MLSHLNTSAVVLLAGAFLLGIFFAYVYQQKRQAYLLVWASAWLLVSLYFVRSAFAGAASSFWMGWRRQRMGDGARRARILLFGPLVRAPDALRAPRRFGGRRGRGLVFRLPARVGSRFRWLSESLSSSSSPRKSSGRKAANRNHAPISCWPAPSSQPAHCACSSSSRRASDRSPVPTCCRSLCSRKLSAASSC